MTNSRQTDHAARFAEGLLTELGSGAVVPDLLQDHPAIAWQRAGLFDLSGTGQDKPKVIPLPLASAADGAMLALKALAPEKSPLPDTGAQLLGERARLMGLERNGRASPTGHCRLVDCADGRIALNLAREEDWDLLPALLQEEAVGDWASIETAAANKQVVILTQRGAEMGMAIARDQVLQSNGWLCKHYIGGRVSALKKTPLVVDLSSLWAGPLAGNLLHLYGARVIKVESTHRPDGAREGNADFFNLLNGGKQCVAVDFRSEEGRRQLRKLIEAADIVIEASRPRALRQLGIDAENLVAGQLGKVWLRILAHGDDESRIGFGDDIGVAAGLPTLMEQVWGEPLMVGDAIADPLTGIFGALAALECWQAGGGVLAEISMRDVVIRATQHEESNDLAKIASQWQVIAEECELPPYAQRPATGAAEQLGQSTRDVMDSLC